MSMEDYMSSCGMQTIVSNDVLTETQESSFRIDPSSQLVQPVSSENGLAGVASLDQNATAESAKIMFTTAPPILSGGGGIASINATTSTSVLAMRKMFFVTRQQFHIALEAFNTSPSDVNLLFSALDVGVEDHAALWEILCAVEKLQDGHAQLRRSRVQIKARDLPKDLDLLRNSFRIPNVTHSPLEVTQGAKNSLEATTLSANEEMQPAQKTRASHVDSSLPIEYTRKSNLPSRQATTETYYRRRGWVHTQRGF